MTKEYRSKQEQAAEEDDRWERELGQELRYKHGEKESTTERAGNHIWNDLSKPYTW